MDKEMLRRRCENCVHFTGISPTEGKCDALMGNPTVLAEACCTIQRFADANIEAMVSTYEQNRLVAEYPQGHPIHGGSANGVS